MTLEAFRKLGAKRPDILFQMRKCFSVGLISLYFCLLFKGHLNSLKRYSALSHISFFFVNLHFVSSHNEKN